MYSIEISYCFIVHELPLLILEQVQLRDDFIYLGLQICNMGISLSEDAQLLIDPKMSQVTADTLDILYSTVQLQHNINFPRDSIDTRTNSIIKEKNQVVHLFRPSTIWFKLLEVCTFLLMLHLTFFLGIF